MDRRQLAYVTMAALAVLCLAMIAGVLFPLSTADPTPLGTQFEVGDADSYRVTANLTTDGAVSFGSIGAISATGPRYAKIVEANTTTESYQNTSRDGVVYERIVVEGEQAERLLEYKRDARDVEVVDASWAGETVTVLAIDRSDDAQVDPTGMASVIANSMRLARYEPADAAGDAARTDGETGGTVLEPRGGWYDGGGPSDDRTYRLTDVSGEVRVDPDTNVLSEARVEWTFTNPADTYVHYLLARASAGDTDQTYEYTYEPGAVDVERPAWVRQLQAES